MIEPMKMYNVNIILEVELILISAIFAFENENVSAWTRQN